VDGSSSSGVKFRSTWTWQGAPDNVKSFIYCGRQFPKGRLISSIPSMQTSVSWSYSTQDLRANVAYDVFTATDPNHANSSGDYELMIWLARLGGVYPIGKSTGTVTVAGRSWDLWVGMNGQMRVYSFVAASPVTTFSAALKLFFNYLQTTQNYPASKQNLIGRPFLHRLTMGIHDAAEAGLLTQCPFSLPNRHGGFHRWAGDNQIRQLGCDYRLDWMCGPREREALPYHFRILFCEGSDAASSFEGVPSTESFVSWCGDGVFPRVLC
jgi:hypothetical protein